MTPKECFASSEAIAEDWQQQLRPYWGWPRRKQAQNTFREKSRKVIEQQPRYNSHLALSIDAGNHQQTVIIIE